MPSFNEFYSNLTNTGIANSNRFEVFIAPPAVLGSDLDQLTMYAKSVSLGGEAFTTNTFRGLQRPDIFATSLNPASELAITFMLDREWSQYKIFKEWIEKMAPFGDRLVYPADYISHHIDTNALDRTGKIMATDRSFNCFPMSVGKVRLDHSEKNTVPILDVVFARKTV